MGACVAGSCQMIMLIMTSVKANLLLKTAGSKIICGKKDINHYPIIPPIDVHNKIPYVGKVIQDVAQIIG
jgi:hypothetical protein